MALKDDVTLGSRPVTVNAGRHTMMNRHLQPASSRSVVLSMF
jgi:hypothetical protein